MRSTARRKREKKEAGISCRSTTCIPLLGGLIDFFQAFWGNGLWFSHWIILFELTGSGLTCGPGNGLHHWTDSLCGPPQIGKDKVFLTLDPLYTTDIRISKSMLEHFLETVWRTQAWSCSCWEMMIRLFHTMWTWLLGFWGGGSHSQRGWWNWKKPLPITLSLNPWDIEQVDCFFKRVSFIANDCIAIVRDVSDLGQVPSRRLFWLRLIPKSIYKGIPFWETHPELMGDGRSRQNPLNGEHWEPLMMGLKAIRKIRGPPPSP